MQRVFKYLLIAFVLLMLPTLAGAQSIDELREQIRIAEEEIRINNELLEKTRKDQKLSESQLKIIRERIRNRQAIVTSLEKQINMINSDIGTKNRTLNSLNSQVEQLKKEYAEMARTAYKNHKLNNFLLFLFASEDFNDAIRRINFMRRYNNMRVDKSKEIRILSDSIGLEVEDLGMKLADLDNTKAARGKELSSLNKDENQYRSSVEQLRGQEGRLTKEVKAKQQQIADAQKKIEELITAEARRSQQEERTEAEDRYMVELSGKFDENRGKLPYPIQGGVIVDRYGSHPHPTATGLIIKNNGVNIAGAPGAAASCVFEGEVTKIVAIPGLNNCVMVRHGSYITLYANLSSVAVKTGDKVSLNQRIGNISRSPNNDDNFLHFEIWKETSNLNPEQWLRR